MTVTIERRRHIRFSSAEDNTLAWFYVGDVERFEKQKVALVVNESRRGLAVITTGRELPASGPLWARIGEAAPQRLEVVRRTKVFEGVEFVGLEFVSARDEQARSDSPGRADAPPPT